MRTHAARRRLRLSGSSRWNWFARYTSWSKHQRKRVTLRLFAPGPRGHVLHTSPPPDFGVSSVVFSGPMPFGAYQGHVAGDGIQARLVQIIVDDDEEAFVIELP